MAGLPLNQLIKRFKTIQWSWVDGCGAVGPGCGLWKLPPSMLLSDWRIVAEVVVMGRWFQFIMVRGKELHGTGWLMCSWCSRWVPLVLGSTRWQKPVRLMSTNLSSGTAFGVGCGLCVPQDCPIPFYFYCFLFVSSETVSTKL